MLLDIRHGIEEGETEAELHSAEEPEVAIKDWSVREMERAILDNPRNELHLPSTTKQYSSCSERPMYIMVQHTISDPPTFWNAADPNTISPDIKLHHTFPTPDGTRAVCIWEGASVEAVRNLLEPLVGRISKNEYFPVENREGFARPSRVPQTAAAGSSGR